MKLQFAVIMQVHRRYEVLPWASLWCKGHFSSHTVAVGCNLWGSNVWSEDASEYFQVFLLEDGGSNNELLFHNSNHPLSLCVYQVLLSTFLNLGIEVTKDNDFVICSEMRLHRLQLNVTWSFSGVHMKMVWSE